MAFTDKSTLFAAVDETGVNLVARHVLRQRPSLFNFGTAWVAAAPDRRLCRPVDATLDVVNHQNPLLTVMDPIPIPLTNDAYALDFCVQLTEAQIDFHPADVVVLPPEVDPLPEQRAVIRGRACGGIGCPPVGVLAGLPPPPTVPPEPPVEPVVVHPVDDAMNCFCLDFFAVAGAAVTGAGAQLQVSATLDRLEIVDLAPAELESNLECLLQALIVVGVFPRLRAGISTLLLDLLADLPGISFSAPGPPAVGDNPAIEDDRLEVFLNLES